MCRLLGILSVKDSNASKYILQNPCSLYAQSNTDSERLQSDGWGIGYYVNRVPHFVKSKKPIYTELKQITAAVQAANSRIVLVHIRRASNPRGLPRDKIISIENSQPFEYNNYLFVHNGMINIPDDVAENLGDWRTRIKGLNDSEVYFWHLIRQIMQGHSFPQAVREFEETLTELWQRHREKNKDLDRPYVGLNTLFSDGEKLYAYCKYDEEKDLAKSLCFRDQRAFQISYQVNDSNLIVVSEKTNRKDK